MMHSSGCELDQGEGRGGEGEGLERSRLADTHGIRARWDSESDRWVREVGSGMEHMDARGMMEPLSHHRFQVLPICPNFLPMREGREEIRPC